MSKALLVWVLVYAAHYQVDPALALAVMHIESRELKGGRVVQDYRLGRLGRSRYWGPGGLNQDCFPGRPWEYQDPILNIKNTVKALQGSDPIRVLRRYNPEASRAYISAVLGERARVQGTARLWAGPGEVAR